MKNVKLVASDMDHTLLTEDNKLPEGFGEYVDRLHERGIHFIAASGRPMYSLKEMFTEYEDRMGFISDNGALIEADGKIIELRAYNTVHGIWKYFTVDDGQFDTQENLLAIGTLESYVKMKEYFGEEKMVPLYIEVEDGLRLERALRRERKQDSPKYEEMCRRFLSDAADFSEENLKECNITKRFINDCLEDTIEEIVSYIKETGKET